MARSTSHGGHFARGAVTGLVAGAIGTAAMDGLWYRRYRRGGGTETPLEWEFASDTNSWEHVSAPGRVGHLVLRRLVGPDVPDRWARTTQNVVHWATGAGWGAQLGLLAVATTRMRWVWGLGLGVAVFATSYVTLPLADIYKPIWQYDAATLAQDLSAHLVYGAATGAALAALLGDPSSLEEYR
jgi:hypothetical protein